MAKPDYDTTLARIAGNIASGLLGTAHFSHPDGVRNHQELIAVSVDLARQIVGLVKHVEMFEAVPLSREPDVATDSATRSDR